MKLCLGNTPVKSLNIRKLDVDTNDATIVASDMQSGMTAYAKGVKVTGTGKSFAFASYGEYPTNYSIPIPGMINIVEVSSTAHPIKLMIMLSEMKDADFSVETQIATITVNGLTYPITAKVENNGLTLGCEVDANLQVFYGKDDHV